MPRDTKIGLVIGLILVAVVAVVFYKRGDQRALTRQVAGELVQGWRDRWKEEPGAPYEIPPGLLERPLAPPPGPASAPAPDGGEEEGGEQPRLQLPQARPVPADAADEGLRYAGPPAAGSSPAPKSAHGASRSGAAQRYTIAEGDTLCGIAERFYGDRDLYRIIVAANRTLIRDPDLLEVGVTIALPPPPAASRSRSAAARVADAEEE